MLSLGAFPEVSLASARTKRDDARKLLAEGIDPSQQKKLDKIAAATAANNTFGAIAEEHLKNLEEGGAAETTLTKNRWLLQTLAAPLTNRPIAEITPAEVLAIFKKVEKCGRREASGHFFLKTSIVPEAASAVRSCRTWRRGL
jgi:Arm DNA-binding domain